MQRLLEVASADGVSGSLASSANRDYAAIAHFHGRFGFEMWHIHMTRGGRK
jgi:hypothetical protein